MTLSTLGPPKGLQWSMDEEKNLYQDENINQYEHLWKKETKATEKCNVT